MRRLSAAAAVLAATVGLVTAASAAEPKHPATFTGADGMGLPVTFKLGQRGRPTYAAVAFACKSGNGALVANSRKPSGSVAKSGRLSISYAVNEPQLGRVKVELTGHFSSRAKVKGTATLTNGKCFGKNPGKVRFRASV